MRVLFTRPVEGKIKTIQIKRELNFYYAIFTCEIEDQTQPQAQTQPQPQAEIKPLKVKAQ